MSKKMDHTRGEIVRNYTAQPDVQETLVPTDRTLSDNCIEGLIWNEACIVLNFVSTEKLDRTFSIHDPLFNQAD